MVIIMQILGELMIIGYLDPSGYLQGPFSGAMLI